MALKSKVDRRPAAWSIKRAEFDEWPILAVVDQSPGDQGGDTVEINFKGVPELFVSFQEGDVVQAGTLFQGREMD